MIFLTKLKIFDMKQDLYNYLLILGDNSLILGHRLSELCGHGPTLETDIALTNLSLDLFGQVRSIFQYAAKLQEDNASEDTVAMLRNERQYHNVILVEHPNIDFAYVIARQFLFDLFYEPLLLQLMQSRDEMIAAIASKSIKECRYHLRFSTQWLRRLAGGTEESHKKIQVALSDLIPLSKELFYETEIEEKMKLSGIGADLSLIQPEYHEKLQRLLDEYELQIPIDQARMAKGKLGIHTEELGHILSELQFMQRAYPGMQW